MATLETHEHISKHVSTASRARRRREHRLVRFLILFDGVAVALSTLIASFVASPDATMAEKAIWALITLLACLVAFSFYRLYERDRQQIAVSTLDEIRDYLGAVTLVGFLEVSLMEAIYFDASTSPIGPGTVLAFWLSALVLLPVVRATTRHQIIPRLSTPQNTLIVGAGEVGQMLARKLRKHPHYNLRLVGFLDDDPHPVAEDLSEVPVLGSEDDLVETLREQRVSRVILAFSKRPPQDVLELIRTAGLRDVRFSVVPRYFEIIAANAAITDIEGVPILELPAPGLSRFAMFTKRSLDLALTVPAVLVLAPLLGAVALAIKIDSRGPVFFRQRRMGRNEMPFDIIKFRTMVDEAEMMRDLLTALNEASAPLFKIREDPRITRVGAVLRKLSLDELPQLFNVLKGEMSLVGPRPFVVHEDEKINGWARRRLGLTPGITGVWQVLDREDIEFEEMVKLDHLYVNNWSLWWDVKLILRTIAVVFTRRGY
jgi:exopolysaccharide biosynthesis polyprenyl glycosylphosphotransferase